MDVFDGKIALILLAAFLAQAVCQTLQYPTIYIYNNNSFGLPAGMEIEEISTGPIFSFRLCSHNVTIEFEPLAPNSTAIVIAWRNESGYLVLDVHSSGLWKYELNGSQIANGTLGNGTYSLKVPFVPFSELPKECGTIAIRVNSTLSIVGWTCPVPIAKVNEAGHVVELRWHNSTHLLASVFDPLGRPDCSSITILDNASRVIWSGRACGVSYIPVGNYDVVYALMGSPAANVVVLSKGYLMTKSPPDSFKWVVGALPFAIFAGLVLRTSIRQSAIALVIAGAFSTGIISILAPSPAPLGISALSIIVGLILLYFIRS